MPPRTGGQGDAIRPKLSTQPYRTPLLFHLRARAFPAATSANQKKKLIKHEANQMPNHQPSSCRVAELLHHACARLAACRDLEFHSGVQRPLRGQELGWKKNKREKTGQRPSGPDGVPSTFFSETTAQLSKRGFPVFSSWPYDRL